MLELHCRLMLTNYKGHLKYDRQSRRVSETSLC